MQLEDGSRVARDKGTPQGGVISPLLSNLFLHYVFDRWMRKQFPDIPFERYADDAICHCKTLVQAQQLLAALEQRFAECHLELHPQKPGWCIARMMIDEVAILITALTFWALRFGPGGQRIDGARVLSISHRQ
ncbi:reverse transcriptase domain-containing protein [Undibacterium arcticum]|uniref:reverse transcriptase domain-containing protein n=1 Tax=Undibacterium arcticum TaxID=1762892 RepID=UPI00361021FA